MAMNNRGHGAGGSNTNKNGLTYEHKTDLSTYTQTLCKKNYKYFKIKFKYCDNIFICAHKSGLKKYMTKNNEMNTEIMPAHGCKMPDECYINTKSKFLFIIEKKFQQCSGSVCEKIQTTQFKLWHYKQLYPNFNIKYIYCLSSWFKNNCKAEIEFLKLQNIPIFWGDSPTYKEDIIKYIISF